VHWHLLGVDGTKNDPDRATIEDMLDSGKLFWLDMNGIDDDGLDMLGQAFGIHPLALEDVTEFGQRPKIEAYDDVTYLVTYGAGPVRAEPAEVHCFYSERFLVTVRAEHCDSLNQLREYVKKAGGQLPGDRQPTQLIFLHHVLDTLIDSYFPMLAEFDDQIDDLQVRIFTRPNDDDLEDLFSMQRSLVGMRKLVTPQRDMMSAIVSGMVPLPGMTPEREPYVRDLYDHLIRISDLVDSYRDVLSNAMDAYLSVVSNNLNVVMKQLTSSPRCSCRCRSSPVSSARTLAGWWTTSAASGPSSASGSAPRRSPSRACTRCSARAAGSGRCGANRAAPPWRSSQRVGVA
jgi:magnesium transporter